jgi:hypothetical protein
MPSARLNTFSRQNEKDCIEGSLPDGLHWRSSGEFLQVEKKEGQVRPSPLYIHRSADLFDSAEHSVTFKLKGRPSKVTIVQGNS